MDDGGSSVSSETNRPRVSYPLASSSSCSRSRARAAGCVVAPREHRLEERADAVELRGRRHGGLVGQAVAERRAELLHPARRPPSARRPAPPGTGAAATAGRRPSRRTPSSSISRRAVAGPDALRQLQHAEPADLVERVLQHAEQRQRVLHVRGLQELQPAVLHERDVAPGQLHLEQVAVVRRAEQHGLLLQRHALLAMLQARCGTRRRTARPRPGTCGGSAVALAVPCGPQRLLVALRRERDRGVRRGEDRRDRSVVLLQPDHGGAGEPLGNSRMLRTVAARNP